MYLYLTIIVILFGAISLIGTILVGKKVDKTTAEYKMEADRNQAQLERSRDYETSSLKKNVKVLILIYAVTFLLAILAVAIYIMTR